MDYSLRFLVQFVLIWGPALSNVFFAQGTGTMSGASEDASDITWAHAVNSKSALEKALGSPVDFLEADISMGHTVSNERTPPIPIMAHPPNATSDISLEDWLNAVAKQRPDKGLKLDFKSIEAVEPSLQILEKYTSQLNGSLWLHADVLQGPVRSPITPVEPAPFLSLRDRYFPKMTLSLGWTTYWMRKFPEGTWHYEWKDVRQMADVLRCHYENDYPPITFSVRAIFASRSIKQLQWLLRFIPHSSVTVWSAQGDNVDAEDFLRIQRAFPEERIYYIVPEYVKSLLQTNTIAVDHSKKYTPDKFDNRWLTVTRERETSCESFTYTEYNSIVFGRSSDNLAFQQNLLLVNPNNNFTVKGRLKFFASDHIVNPTHWEHKFKFILANVNRLPKKSISYSKKRLSFSLKDPEILWSTVKSSVLYMFDHQYFQDSSSCRMFHLDVNTNIAFDAWTIPCDESYEYNSEENVAKASIPEISLEEKLEDPEGIFLIGFYSYGEEYVIAYDLNVSGTDGTKVASVFDWPKQLAQVSSKSALGGNVTLVFILSFLLILLLSQGKW